MSWSKGLRGWARLFWSGPWGSALAVCFKKDGFMKRKNAIISLIIGAIALFPALAPASRTSDEAMLRKLAEAKVVVTRKIVDFYADVRLAPPGNRLEAQVIPGLDPVETWTRRLVDARLEASNDRDERIKILDEEVARTRAIEARLKELVERGPGLGKIDSLKAEFHRLDADYRLLKEKSEK
jgi:hypothetical protein